MNAAGLVNEKAKVMRRNLVNAEERRIHRYVHFFISITLPIVLW